MLTIRQEQSLSSRKIELWYAIEQIALASSDVEQTRREVTIELARFIEHGRDTAELENLIRKVCRYE